MDKEKIRADATFEMILINSDRKRLNYLLEASIGLKNMLGSSAGFSPEVISAACFALKHLEDEYVKRTDEVHGHLVKYWSLLDQLEA